MTAHLLNGLKKRKKLGNLRQLRVVKNLVDFASNDYLGLARSPELAAAAAREMRRHPSMLSGLGSTGSRLLTGNSTYAQDLENELAAFHGYEAAQLFSCGYMANVGLLSAIAGSGDRIYYDAGVHASTHDGIRLCRAQGYPFRHNDAGHLEKRLKSSSPKGSRYVCIESIYSTDGSIAPMETICRLANEYEAHVIVDEAHAIGVCGPHGRGLVAELNLTSQVFAQIVTFGKALGTYGAMVLGSHILKQTLINFATSYIYTTALPFYTLAAIKCSYDLLPKLDPQRRHLQHLIGIFRQEHHKGSAAHIQPVPIKGNAAARQASQKLMKLGFDARALLSPTVQQGNELLRISLHAHNTEAELKALLDHLIAFPGSRHNRLQLS